MNYLALGDSYTIGEGVEQTQTWPFLISDKLQPKVIATTGWTTRDLIDAIDAENVSQKFDVVSLLIGVNNQYQGLPFSIYENEFIELLEIAISLSKYGKDGVFVLSIPDYGVTPFAQKKRPEKIDRELKVYNMFAKEVCSQHQIPFFDIYQLSKEARNDHTLLAEDQLHPSGKMYQMWVDSFKDKLKSKFKV